ncbi:hypothetical protein ACFYXQ_45155, partial [Nocardia jiangxiensis]
GFGALYGAPRRPRHSAFGHALRGRSDEPAPKTLGLALLSLSLRGRLPADRDASPLGALAVGEIEWELLGEVAR